jgi:hypothetical protein
MFTSICEVQICLNGFFDSDWEATCQDFRANKLWQYCLIALGSASSLIYPHPPLVCFATLAGITLNRRQAVTCAALIWFVNQLYGFTVRHYPLSAIALLWGASMGLGTIIVALIASIQPPFSHRSLLGQILWLAITLLLGFTVYQSGTLLVNQWVQMHGLTADIFLRIFVRDGIWTIGLFVFYIILVVNHQRILQRISR